MWPGYRDNLRTLLWLLQLKNGEATGTQTPVGILPAIEKLDLEGRDVATADLGRLPIIDTAMTTGDHNRKEHLAQFDGLPEQIWEAHRRVTAALHVGATGLFGSDVRINASFTHRKRPATANVRQS